MSLPIGAVRVIIVVFVFTILDFIAIGLRVWSRYIQRLPLALNDWMAILALIFATGSVTNQLIAVFLGGIGYHIADIMAKHPEKLLVYLKYNWDQSIAGTCNVRGQSVAYEAAGSINLVIDAFVVGLPMPKLFGLQMVLSKKLGLASMFSLGAIICIISLLRVITVAHWDLNDITYSSSGVSVYSVLEPTLGIINICLPTIRPAMLAIAGRNPGKGHSVPAYSIENESGWNYHGKGSGMISEQARLQSNVDDLPMTQLDRLGDEFPPTTRVACGRSGAAAMGRAP
ncbi:hypothetical protein VPNG_02754 [Cytospora leucostoma]|uniref:Rhodopsin domain-containing protein n=1 Tax=Cytospora leucostoma TaxID=1230097 RepID=A0A423XJ93_9PEZI|nr:hypothetical protein VPNG_02754 [Cytospora leucostoma]